MLVHGAGVPLREVGMEPDSIVLVVLLVVVAVGGVVLVARAARWWIQALAGGLALVVALACGAVAVNDYYGYYTSWGQLAADFGGSTASYDSHVVERGRTSVGTGRIETLTLRGARSGITRPGLVFLPPQYFQPRFAHTRFPVVELIHGTPGDPSAYPVQLQLQAVVRHLMARHEAGPTIFVMPDISAGNRFEECVDAPGALDDTYVTRDVRADVLARFRAATDPAEWGIAGYSSGGYCAAALHHDAAAERANDPLATAAALPADVSPLPAFWISAGTGEIGDYRAAKAFVNALHGVEQVDFVTEHGVGHNFYAWRTALPPLLAWLWTQLAPPSLRVQFPVAGTARAGTLPVGRIPRTHRHERGPGPSDRPTTHGGRR